MPSQPPETSLSLICVIDGQSNRMELGSGWIDQEFLEHNTAGRCELFRQSAGAIPLQFEPHQEFKQDVLQAIGLTRTAGHNPVCQHDAGVWKRVARKSGRKISNN